MTKVLKLALLGRIQLNGGHNLLPSLVSAKAQALLCYLAVTGQPHSRQALAGLLWGELPEADARRNLRGVVMKLRQELEPYLIITNQSLAFNQESDYWLDVEVLTNATNGQNLHDTGQLRQIVGLYRGEFMADFQVGYAPAFEDWLMMQRAVLQERALGAYLQLARLCVAQGAYSEGVEYVRRLLQIDPVREEAYRQLMWLLALNGQRSLALAQYEICRKVLEEELGVEPGQETADLAERIRAGDLNRAEVVSNRRPQSDMPIVRAAFNKEPEPPIFLAGPPITYPARFFGRQRELRRLFHLLRRRPLQNGAIFGPRRSGKTSLLHYLKAVTTASSSQLRVEQRQDWLPQPEEYNWVFVDFQDHRFGDLAYLLPYLLAEMDLSVPEPCDLDMFLDIVSSDLETPTVILFDEMEVALQRYPELDDAFWESLRSLATNQVDGNLAFILSSAERPYELAQHQGYGSPFFNIFGYMAKLGPLTEEEARELIATAPQPFAPEEVAWILHESGRWPILLQILCREYLIALEEGEVEGWREEALRQLAPFSRLLDEG